MSTTRKIIFNFSHSQNIHFQSQNCCFKFPALPFCLNAKLDGVVEEYKGQIWICVLCSLFSNILIKVQWQRQIEIQMLIENDGRIEGSPLSYIRFCCLFPITYTNTDTNTETHIDTNTEWWENGRVTPIRYEVLPPFSKGAHS